MKFLLTLCLWITVSLARFVHAQPPQMVFHHLTDLEGLPNTEVRKLIQTRDGMLWMACANRLVSYDGYSISSGNEHPTDSFSISGNIILNIYEDSKGRLWVTSYGQGIHLSDRSKTNFSKISIPRDSLAEPYINVSEIAEDSTGRFWIVTNEGLKVLEESKEGFSLVDLSEIFQGDCDVPTTANTLHTARNGAMWIGTRNGMYKLNLRDNVMHCPEDFPALQNVPIQKFAYDLKRRLWIVTGRETDRIYYEYGDRFKPFNGLPLNTNFRTGELVFDHDNRMWLTVFADQVYGYDFRDSSVFLKSSENPYLNHERFFRTPLVDHSGMVWLLSEGFYTYPYPKGFKSYQHPFDFNQSCSVIFHTDKAHWFSFRENGLVRVDIATNEVTRRSETLEGENYIPEDLLGGMLELRNGHIVVIGFGVVFILDENEKLLRQFPVNGSIRGVFQDSKDRLWIGGIAGLYLFNEDTGIVKTYKLPSMMKDTRNFIQSMVDDRDGNIWFTSDIKGLARLNPETEEIRHFLPFYGDTSSLPGISVNDIVIDKNNMIYLATDNAFVKIDPVTEKIRTYNFNDGLQSNNIAGLVLDDKGIIWMATDAGISSFDPSTEKFENYNRQDGLINLTYNERSRSYYNGYVYFGGIHGVDYFHPDYLRKNPTAPILKLTKFNSVKFGKPTDNLYTQGEVRLSHNDDLIEIEFSGLHYTDQTGISYLYKMEPIHKEWVDLGDQHKVLFSNLKPGDYEFHARAVTHDGVWSARDLVIPFCVTPPFYQTVWFRLLMIMAAVGMIIGYIRYRERMIERREKKEAEVSRQMMELEKRALQAQMNPHFIYNSMNSIQQFIIVHDVEGAMKYLTRFSRILRTVLNMSGQSRIPLYEEINLIKDYLELENMRFPDKFTYEIKVSPELNIHAAEIPPFFIQPQVENAIRHGLLKKPTPGHLTVDIRTEGDHLLITVEDNGIGRQASGEIKYADPGSHVSKGISIVEERLRHLHSPNGHQHFRIIDLFDNAQNPTGTRVEIELPMD